MYKISESCTGGGRWTSSIGTGNKQNVLVNYFLASKNNMKPWLASAETMTSWR